MEEKKPDSIVYDKKEGYNASLLPYGTNVGAPSIKKEDVSVFLHNSGVKVNHFFEQRFTEIREQFQSLMDLHELNQMIYSSELRFEPVMGYTYHLYERKDGKKFLSLVGPTEWNMSYICSVTLNTDGQWVLLKDSSTKK